MRRREFIALLSAAGITGSARVAAQETGRIYRIGFLTGNAREEPVNSALFNELRGMGFVESQNLSVVPGGFRLRDEQLAEAAAALVKSAPDAIVTAGPIATRAAQAATKTIAIVGSADDMVQAGLVLSMRHPGAQRQAAGPTNRGNTEDSPPCCSRRSQRCYTPAPTSIEGWSAGTRRGASGFCCVHQGSDHTCVGRGEWVGR